MSKTSIISPEDAFQKFTNAVNDNTYAMLVGAGISTLPPSGLLSGVALKNLIIESIFSPPEFQSALYKLKASSKFVDIVPEVLFQEIFSVIENRIFEIYNILSFADSNLLHFALANIVNRHSGKIYTTNFDLLIDRHITDEGLINHLHGSLNNPTEMVILINQVGKGINRQNKIDFFKNADGCTLLVLGYSGNDNDIIQLINQSNIREIIWLIRDLSDESALKNIRNIKSVPCYLFKEDLSLYTDRIVKWLHADEFNEIANDFTDEKARIIDQFKNSFSSFERYYIMHLILFRIEDYNEALNFCRICLDKKIAIILEHRLIATIAFSDIIRIIGKNMSHAQVAINKALKENNIHNFPFLIGKLNNCKGLLFLEGKITKPKTAIGFFERAIVCYHTCLKNEKNKINRQKIYTALSSAYNNLGLAYDTIRVYDKAIESYKQSVRIKIRLGNLIALSTTQVNICIAFLKAGDLRRSQIWEYKAIKIINKYDQYYRKAFLFRQKGFFIAQINKPKGVQLLREALAIYNKHIPDAKFDIELTVKRLAYAEGL